jgi:hypothetical protein
MGRLLVETSGGAIPARRVLQSVRTVDVGRADMSSPRTVSPQYKSASEEPPPRRQPDAGAPDPHGHLSNVHLIRTDADQYVKSRSDLAVASTLPRPARGQPSASAAWAAPPIMTNPVWCNFRGEPGQATRRPASDRQGTEPVEPAPDVGAADAESADPLVDRSERQVSWSFVTTTVGRQVREATPTWRCPDYPSSPFLASSGTGRRTRPGRPGHRGRDRRRCTRAPGRSLPAARS